MSEKEYAFLQFLGGTLLFFLVIVYLMIMTADNSFGQSETIFFSILGMTAGCVGGILLLNGYYKLTGRLGFKKYQIAEEITEVTVDEESEIADMKIKDVTLPPLVTISIIEREGEMIPPRGDTEISEGDRVVLTGRPDVVTDVADLFQSPE